MAEEGDPAGEEGTREKKRKRPMKKDLVCVLCILFLLCCLSYLHRMSLKNRKRLKENRKNKLGCVLNLS